MAIRSVWNIPEDLLSVRIDGRLQGSFVFQCPLKARGDDPKRPRDIGPLPVAAPHAKDVMTIIGSVLQRPFSLARAEAMQREGRIVARHGRWQRSAAKARPASSPAAYRLV
jgi:hypothetical protein